MSLIMNKIYPVFIYIVRLVLGVVFIYASYDKILDPSKFARDISNYHIVPFGLENTVAIVLPWLELFLGIGIVLGIYIDGNTLLSAFLLLLFNFLIFQAMVRGFNIECGCGLKEGELVGWRKLIENFTLFGGACLILLAKKRGFEFYPRT